MLTALTVCAQSKQWTLQDSIYLKQILNGNGELKLNPEAVKKIDFGGLVGSPGISTEKSWMAPDETLPSSLPDQEEKSKVILTLFPFTNAKFNRDALTQKKFKVTKNTWRGSGSVFANMYIGTVYSNWAKKPMDGGERKSLEEIEATGLRYNMLGERANNMAVGQWQGKSATFGKSAYAPMTGGIGFTGDFMAPFTKDFWDVKGKKRRARTLEVLQSYGDSTTAIFPDYLPH